MIAERKYLKKPNQIYSQFQIRKGSDGILAEILFLLIMNRRKFSEQLLRVIASYSLLGTLSFPDLQATSVKPIMDRWQKELHEISLDLKQGGLKPAQWQSQVDQLFAQISLPDLLERIDFEGLVRQLSLPEQGVNTRPISLPQLSDLPERLAFYSKLFGMKKDRAVIPHGHQNMASIHYVLAGEVHLRQYEKLAADKSHMLIHKTVDETGEVGSYSSISDEKNNIHWLKATSPTAFTFDVMVLDIAGKPYDINNIDPHRGSVERRGMRVPKITVAEGLERYGYDPHH